MTIVTVSVTILAQGVILCLLCAQLGDFFQSSLVPVRRPIKDGEISEQHFCIGL